MGDLSKDEVKAMKVKEAKNRKEKELASKIHDAEVMDSMRSSMGAPTAAQAAMPAQPPAPVDPMGNVAGPAPTGMKKGGKVKSSASSRGDGIAQRGKTRGKYC
jgi:hypothetical protein